MVNEREELGPDLVRWYRTMPLRLFVAPLGLAFYTGDNLPQKYLGGFFLADMGAGTGPINGYKVIFVPFSNGRWRLGSR